MNDGTTDFGGFEHTEGFIPGEVTASVGLGPLENHYQALFAEAIADGVVSAEERSRLERAARDLGLDRRRLIAIEQALVGAHQSRSGVRISEQDEEPALSPVGVEAEGAASVPTLQERIRVLEARVRVLEHELQRARTSVNVEVDLSDLESHARDVTEDPEDVWRRLRRNPTSTEGYRHLFRIHVARGAADRAQRVAQVLVALGTANAEEESAAELGREKTLIAPRGSLSPSDWNELLMHPEQELLTGQIFGLITPAVLVGRVTSLRHDGKLRLPAPAAKQEVAKATLTAVRAVPWAAAVLGLACPTLYVERERDAGFEHVPAVPPCSVIGKRVLSGKSQLEQAFLVGRHLTWYRQDMYLKTLFGAVPDLEDLFLAALTLASPGLPLADAVKRRVTPIAQAIRPLLAAAQLDALRGCFLRFVEDGGRANLQRWSDATEKTAARAGLLLSGDLSAALGLLEGEEGAQGELATDLLWFSAGERYGKLRRQLGVATSVVS